MTDLRQRMYGLVPYNISPIQQGIQFGHAVQEYNNIYMDGAMSKENRSAFDRWRKEDKTFVILNGGTTNLNIEKRGSLNQYEIHLSTRLGVQTALFHEEDLGDQLTAVVFVLDERVWDKEKYPSYDGPFVSTGYTSSPMEPHYSEWKEQFGYEADRIIELREFISGFKLA